MSGIQYVVCGLLKWMKDHRIRGFATLLNPGSGYLNIKQCTFVDLLIMHFEGLTCRGINIMKYFSLVVALTVTLTSASPPWTQDKLSRTVDLNERTTYGAYICSEKNWGGKCEHVTDLPGGECGKVASPS